MPADLLAGEELRTRLVCRTFSDCTTDLRNGLISGCYPLDEYYKELPELCRRRTGGDVLWHLPGHGALR